ncbi:Homeodomain-like protein [Armillaria borealis]|uniref:Homeodomain-like protein n=1 Tax=Armillaria borealis TaxID=47425 RepID=A0AA39MED4_9AGAR|nr:Homeodomain-like protein [Armillaria borealis]
MLKGSATRERRSWTDEEDRLLREAVKKEDPNSASPSKWYAIAKHVPDRTNKDCRKRWFAKMASDVVKGGWSPDEDARLVKAIEQCGTRWSMVAAMVQSRNSDQCAKRWTDTLNPAIDRTTWTPEGDALLLKAVSEHGKVWTKIVKTYFPGRTGLSAKNRYNSITRGNIDSRRSQGHSVSASGPVPYVQNVQPPSTSPSGPVVVHMALPPVPIPQLPPAMYNSPSQGMRLPFPIS